MKTLQAVCGPDDTDSAASARADRIVQRLTGLSRAGVRGLFDHGCVMVNGTPCDTSNKELRHGEVVQVRYDPHRRYKETPKAMADPAFELLFEDEHLLVVNKSPHVLTVPAPTDKGKTLIAALESHLSRGGWRAKRSGLAHGTPRLHVIQRLDLGVSGVLVVAKSAKVAADLRGQFVVHKPERSYIAIVAGEMKQPRGTFRSHMATGRTLNRYSTNDPDKGELAVTHYEVLSHGRDATVVRVRLETGRRNQIRVHFSEAGHPVLGDRRYAKELSAHPRWKAKRLALHAQTLEFIHPMTGKAMRFEAELPREFAAFMQRAGK